MDRNKKEIVAVAESEDVDGTNDSNGDSDSSMELSATRIEHNKPGSEALAGIIERVEITNFMCHKKLEIELGKNVNFINGRNGSGKSAIMIAIMICLGCRADATGRGRSLIQMIRDGSGGEARVAVTILNGGSDAYKSHIYGRKIKIERVIRKSGRMEFNLCSDSGIVKSHDRKELHTMLDHLNIQVDNPVAVLTQEEAKLFLKGTSRDKYEFFMKATDLRRIYNTMDDAAANIAKWSASMKKDSRTVEQLEVDLKRAKAELNKLEEIEKIKDKIATLRGAQRWAEHQDQINAVNLVRGEQQKLLAVIQRLDDRLQQGQESLLEMEGNGGSGSGGDGGSGGGPMKRLEDARSRIAQSNELLVQLRAQAEEAKRPLRAKAQELEEGASEIMALEGELQKIEDDIAEANRKVAESATADGEERDLAEEANKISQKKEEVDQELQALSAAAQHDQQRRAQARADLVKAEEVAGHENQTLLRSQAELERLRREQGRPAGGRTGTSSSMAADPALAPYDATVRFLARLVEEVKARGDRGNQGGGGRGRGRGGGPGAAQSFQGPVFGPIGRYVTVRDGHQKWRQVAEQAISPFLMRGFVATTSADQKLLMELMQRAMAMARDGGGGGGPYPIAVTVYMQRSAPRYVPLRPWEADATAAVPRPVLSVESVLAVENDLVYNCLIDQADIDRICLHDEEEDPNKDKGTAAASAGGHSSSSSSSSASSSSSSPAYTSFLVTYDQRSSQKKLRYNLKESILHNGQKIAYNGGYRTRQPAYKTGIQYLGVDATERIATLAEECAQAESRFAEAQAGLKRLRADDRARAEALARGRAKEAQLRDQRRQLIGRARAVSTRQAELGMLQQSADDFSMLESERARLQHTIEQAQDERRELGAAYDRLKAPLQAIRDQTALARRAAADLDVDLRRATEEVALAEAKLERERKIVAKMGAELADKRGRVAEMDAAVALEEGKAQKTKAEAEEYCRNEVPDWDGQPLHIPGRSRAMPTLDIKRLIRVHDKQLQIAVNRQHMAGDGEVNVAAAREKVSLAEDAYNDKLDGRKRLEDRIDRCKSMVKERQRFTRNLRKKLQQGCNELFNTYLNRKGQCGQLSFDFEQQELGMVVQRDSEDRSTQIEDAAMLSGGERSFATLCLLLALGKSIDCPFRVMDEFDVYMDEMSRDRSIRTMIDMALQERHRQFIFITPHSLAGVVETSRECVVHCIEDHRTAQA